MKKLPDSAPRADAFYLTIPFQQKQSKSVYGPGTSRSALSGTVTPGNAGVPVTHFHSVAARASSTLECPHAQRRRGRVTQAVGLTSAGPGRPAGCSRRQLPSMPRAHETRRGHCRGRSRRRAADTSPTCQAALPPLRHCRHATLTQVLGPQPPGVPTASGPHPGERQARPRLARPSRRIGPPCPHCPSEPNSVHCCRTGF